jgi:hypothetical protein
VVISLTEQEEQEFIPLQGFDQINGDDARGVHPQRDLSPVLSSSSIEQPNTPQSVKKSFQKLMKTIESPLVESERAQKAQRRINRLERFTTTEFEESILKDSVIAKLKKVPFGQNYHHRFEPFGLCVLDT